MRRFEGKRALVTGGASGIGRATAERLAAEGASVVVADINADGARAVADGIGAAAAIAYDAADRASCAALVDGAVAGLGGLDVLCNVAGVLDGGPSETFAEEAWDRVIRINLDSCFYLARRALPHLLESRGTIVSVASTAGVAGVPYSAAYAASKHGVVGLTRALAVEYASRGVRVNAICPGGVETPLVARTHFAQPGLDMNAVGRLWPLTGRSSQPEEMAAAIAFLASDEACNATGTILVIDGGQTAI